MNHVNEISAADFEQKVLRSPIPVLVDFYADWCGPCRLLAPILQDVAEELNGSVAVYKVDAVENSELAHRLGIAALPTVTFFKKGHEVARLVARLVGLQNKKRLLDAVRED